MITLAVTTPSDFRFVPTVTSHGWYQLAPFTYDPDTQTLKRLHRLPDGSLVNLTMRGGRGRAIIVSVTSPTRTIIDSAHRNAIQQAVQRMFNLHVRLKPFHNSLHKHPSYAWVVEHGLGRLLAAPTVWENLAKTLMTTNIAWDNTRQIIEKMCALDPDGTFPTPAMIATMDEDDLSVATGAGYRTPHLIEMAQRITNGETAVETWWALDGDGLYKSVKAFNGLGDYAAGSITRLLGHFDRLAIDSMARHAYQHVTGQSATRDSDIRDYYAQFDQWGGLVMWMDSIREQYEDTQPDPALVTEADAAR